MLKYLTSWVSSDSETISTKPHDNLAWTVLKTVLHIAAYHKTHHVACQHQLQQHRTPTESEVTGTLVGLYCLLLFNFSLYLANCMIFPIIQPFVSSTNTHKSPNSTLSLFCGNLLNSFKFFDDNCLSDEKQGCFTFTLMSRSIETRSPS